MARPAKATKFWRGNVPHRLKFSWCRASAKCIQIHRTLAHSTLSTQPGRKGISYLEASSSSCTRNAAGGLQSRKKLCWLPAHRRTSVLVCFLQNWQPVPMVLSVIESFIVSDQPRSQKLWMFLVSCRKIILRRNLLLNSLHCLLSVFIPPLLGKNEFQTRTMETHL